MGCRRVASYEYTCDHEGCDLKVYHHDTPPGWRYHRFSLPSLGQMRSFVECYYCTTHGADVHSDAAQEGYLDEKASNRLMEEWDTPPAPAAVKPKRGVRSRNYEPC